MLRRIAPSLKVSSRQRRLMTGIAQGFVGAVGNTPLVGRQYNLQEIMLTKSCLSLVPRYI